jgi:tetratricopeptide (TPR) repeat protein
MELGGYLIHRLYPAYRLFIDTRQLDLSLVERYIGLMTTRAGWLEAERHFGFRTVILSNLATVSPLALRAFLLEDPAWQLVFLDAQAAVFVRDPPPTMTRSYDVEPFLVIGREPGRWGVLVARVFLRQDPYALAAHLLAVLGDLGQLSELERQATRLLVSRPEDPELLRLRGTARLYAGAEAAAVEDLRASSRLRPRDSQTRYLLARALARLGRGDEALVELDRLLSVDREHRGALRLRERLVGQPD